MHVEGGGAVTAPSLVVSLYHVIEWRNGFVSVHKVWRFDAENLEFTVIII